MLSAMAWTFITGKTEEHLLIPEEIKDNQSQEQIPFFSPTENRI